MRCATSRKSMDFLTVGVIGLTVSVALAPWVWLTHGTLDGMRPAVMVWFVFLLMGLNRRRKEAR